MSQNVIRVYNVSAETTGEGIPVMIGYSGRSYIFQPSDATWERKKFLDRLVDRTQGVASTRKRFSWVKKEGVESQNYIDISPAMATWLFAAGMNLVHKNVLRTGTEMQDVVQQQLKKKQAQLAQIETELAIAEKKAESKLKKRTTRVVSKSVQAQA